MCKALWRYCTVLSLSGSLLLPSPVSQGDRTIYSRSIISAAGVCVCVCGNVCEGGI